MKKITVIRALYILFLIIWLILVIIKWNDLTSGEGWGMAGMMGLFIYASILLVVDYFLVKLIKNKQTLNLIEMLVIVTIIVMLSSYF